MKIDLFDARWKRGVHDLLDPLSRLYPDADLEAPLRALLRKHAKARPAALRDLDLIRDIDPDWFLSQEMVAYVFYVDRFAGTLKDLPSRIPYLRDLGVTYAHMMPLLKPRPGDSDGGYAVMDYRKVNPTLGTMKDLEAACTAFRDAGISPCIDMVLNHTAKEHAWARKAAKGDAEHQALYRMFDGPEMPEAYEATLPEVFPDQAPGNFTYYPDMGKWVWTTFNEFQWDLNWANPEVFLRVLDNIMWLANKGVEVFRLDAVAFMWKQLGTNCQNLPQVHDILQALRQAVRIAAPALIFKAEAIVAPDDLRGYLGEGRHAGKVSNLAYHNSVMVQFWSSLASGDARLAKHTLRSHFPQSFQRATWATYLRCHDDIGWAITEEDAHIVPFTTGPGHRSFLADFYAGRFHGSWARGADFQVNEETGDKRTNGTLASLCGLETALDSGSKREIDLAVRRILMGTALIASWQGIPLLYMGDEIGMLNDHSYLDDPARAGDGRWMQRPEMDWETAHAPEGAAKRIQDGVRHIVARRRALRHLAGDVPVELLDADNTGVLAMRRRAGVGRLTGVFNVTPHVQSASLMSLDLYSEDQHDALADKPAAVEQGRVMLEPYGAVWLADP